jgi:dihydrofolate reductase
MRKIIVFNMLSLDGFFAGIDGNIDWHNVDDEFNDFAIMHTQEFGTIIFGKTTYKLFEDFWPNVINNPKFSKEDQKIAQIIEDMEKIVFSKTIKKVTWSNSSLFHEINSKEIKKWKNKEGKPMAIFGSGTIVQQLTNMRLIDEYRIMINPVVLGKGKSMFGNVRKMFKLNLLNTRVFKNGNILLTYSPSEK